MIYLVISEHEGRERAGPIVYEITVDRMIHRPIVADDIRHGQYGSIIAVLELNPVEGICREVTDDPDFREAIARDPDDQR
jgi:hypothetical protein